MTKVDRPVLIKTALQVLAILCLILLLAMVVHKAFTDMSSLARQYFTVWSILATAAAWIWAFVREYRLIATFVLAAEPFLLWRARHFGEATFLIDRVLIAK